MYQYFDTIFFEKKCIFLHLEHFCSFLEHKEHKKTTDNRLPVVSLTINH